MKNVCLTIGTLILSLNLSSKVCFAENLQGSKKNTYGGTDLQPLVEYLRRYTYVLHQPAYIYNWMNGSDDDNWTGHFSAFDKRGYDLVKEGSTSYWDSFGKEDPQGNSEGRGLYAAVDPIVTRELGRTNWVLTQMHLPSGFRMIDLNRDGNNTVPLDVESILRQLQCPTSDGQTYQLSAIFQGRRPKYHNSSNQNASNDMNPKCIAAMKHVFNDILKIDGFYYDYLSTFFSECQPEHPQEHPDYSSFQHMHNGAFVLTGDHWLEPNRVRIFNSKTTDDDEDRIRIQSMFYKAAHDSDIQLQSNLGYGYIGFYSNYLASYPSYPGYQMVSINYSAGQSTVVLCKPKGGSCIQVPSQPVVQVNAHTSGLSNPLNPLVMSSTSPPPNYRIMTMGDSQLSTFLWPDLDGKTADPQVGTWIKSNLFGCSGRTPYKEITSFYEKQSSSCNKEIQNSVPHFDFSTFTDILSRYYGP